MADDKSGRNKQADDAVRRQREREIATELERGDEREPPVVAEELADFEAALEKLTFPTTGAEIVAAIGQREIESVEGSYRIEELVPETDEETFDSPAAVRVQVQRPTVAAAMKRVIEASESLPSAIRRGTPWNAYEKTFQALQSIESDDEDEGITVISDWIVERITADRKLPSSRAVRREAASWCRNQGYRVNSDDWLGI